VIKEESETTKLREVLEGSSATSNGKSLNDIMSIGPNLLADLGTLLTMHKFVFSADIKKMSRQTNIDPEKIPAHLVERRRETSSKRIPAEYYNVWNTFRLISGNQNIKTTSQRPNGEISKGGKNIRQRFLHG
jgi:hypothetical protein